MRQGHFGGTGGCRGQAGRRQSKVVGAQGRRDLETWRGIIAGFTDHRSGMAWGWRTADVHEVRSMPLSLQGSSGNKIMAVAHPGPSAAGVSWGGWVWIMLRGLARGRGHPMDSLGRPAGAAWGIATGIPSGRPRGLPGERPWHSLFAVVLSVYSLQSPGLSDLFRQAVPSPPASGPCLLPF